MQILVRIVASIIAADVLLVLGLAVSTAVEAQRQRRQVRDLERLWHLDVRTSVARLHRSLGRRLAVPAAVAVLLCSATAAANPQARHLIASVPSTVAQALPIGSTHEHDAAAPVALGDHATSIRALGPVPVTHSAEGTTTARAAHGSAQPTRPATASPRRRMQSPPTVLGVPSSSTEIEVAWTDVAGEDGYRVERSPDGATGWVAVAATTSDVTTFTDSGLSPDTTYFYRVFATAPEGDSPPSDVMSATTVVVPSIPTGVTAVSGSPNEIDLTWVGAADATGYRIERSSDGIDGWSPIATTGQAVTTYSDTGLSPETTYFYRIVATSPSGDSAPSEVATATTSPHPLGTNEGENGAVDVTA